MKLFAAPNTLSYKSVRTKDKRRKIIDWCFFQIERKYSFSKLKGDGEERLYYMDLSNTVSSLIRMLHIYFFSFLIAINVLKPLSKRATIF